MGITYSDTPIIDTTPTKWELPKFARSSLIPRPQCQFPTVTRPSFMPCPEFEFPTVIRPLFMPRLQKGSCLQWHTHNLHHAHKINAHQETPIIGTTPTRVAYKDTPINGFNGFSRQNLRI